MKSQSFVPLLLFGAVFSSALADEHHGMEMSQNSEAPSVEAGSNHLNESELVPVPHRSHSHHGVPILQTNLYPEERAFWEAYNTTTFFNVKGSNKGALGAHVSLTAIYVIFLYPIALMLNNVNSNWYLPVLTLNLGTVLGALFSLAIFSSSVPDLYPKNAYGRMSYILLFAIIVHYVSAVFTCALKWLSKNPEESRSSSFIPLKHYSHQRGSSNVSPSSTLYEFHNDSSFSTESGNHNDGNSSDLPREPSFARNSEATLARIDEDFEVESDINEEPNQVRFSDNLETAETAGLVDSSYVMEKKNSFKTASAKRDTIYNKVFHNKVLQACLKRFGKLSSLIFMLLNYPLFGYLLVYTGVGISVGNLMGEGKKVFNLLAHFIKGGVFVVLGLVSLARYCGCWEEEGLAWNAIKFKTSEKQRHSSWLIRYGPKGLLTMEFIESFLIFFYGSTNVFLEHLSNPGGEWAAKDLQHVSIAFMYIGGGLCGLLTEVYLSQWRFRKVMEYYDNNRHPNKQIQYASPGFSPNPFPAFTIFWTGILMSQHAQSSPVSTAIHEQWGYLLSFGAIIRCFTYLLCIFTKESKYEVRNSKAHKPLRPFTELLVSSALLAGGMIFMESTDQAVQALEYRGLTPMFTLNVSIGLCALLMGWEMSLFYWREWMKKDKY